MPPYIEKAHAVLFAVCSSLNAGTVVPVLMPALWDTVHRLFDLSENIHATIGPDAGNGGEE